jgi:uncharacterized membrane protein YeaQ/YmgE (transglycosylase-associated protein family)
METKPWYKSETIIVGLIGTLASVAVIFSALAPTIGLTPDVVKIVGAIIGALTSLLAVYRRFWLNPETPPAKITK